MIAIQNFLAQNPPGAFGTTVAPQALGSKDGIPVKGAPGKLASLGNLSPPEVSPSPPSSNGQSPADVRADGARLPDVGAGHDRSSGQLAHKRKSIDSSAADSGPSSKNRKGSGSNGAPADTDVHANGKASDDAAKGQGKTTERRKEQNRNAQRAFRERKEKVRQSAALIGAKIRWLTTPALTRSA